MGKPEVLIIERKDVLVSHLKHRFYGKGWKTCTAADSKSAINILRKRRVSVSVVNLIDMKHEGIAFIKAARREYPGVGILTVSDRIFYSIQGMKSGVSEDFLVPFDIETLMGRIEGLIQEKVRNWPFWPWK